MKIWQAVVELRMVTPLSIASPESTRSKGDVDLPIARDPSGSAYVHASSVAGSLRAHAAALDPEWESLLFGGHVMDTGGEAGTAGSGEPTLQPSPLRFLGARVIPQDDPVVHAQTAISRWSGSAADHSLRTREALPADSAIRIYLTAENLTDTQFTALKQVLTSWSPTLGGSTTTGFGDAQVKSISERQLDLSREADLITWLAESGPESFTGAGFKPLNPGQGPTPDTSVLKFRLAGDLRIGTGKPVDSVGLTLRGRDNKPMIPGTAWKGVFRSRAEYILRSVGIGACCSTDGRTCGTCASCQLFGYSGSASSTGSETAETPIGHRSRVRFWDSPIDNARLEQRTHVSIDRFTGGATRGRLFTEEVVASGRVTLNYRIDEDVRSWAEPLLGLVARDIHDGYVGIGHGTTRGLGFLELQTKIQPDPGWQDECRAFLESKMADSTVGAGENSGCEEASDAG